MSATPFGVATAVKPILLLGLGGFVGSNARYWTTICLRHLLGDALPWGTLFVNGLGSLIIGFLIIFLPIKFGAADDLKLLFNAGLLGAFTTFSSFSLETVQLYSQKGTGAALLNIALNVILAVGAAAVGMTVAKQLYIH